MPQPPPPPTPGRTGLSRAEWTGLLLMLAATTMLGLFPSGARLAYDGGGSPETLSVLRHIASFTFVGLLLAARRRGGGAGVPRLPAPAMLGAAGLGIVLAFFGWAYFAALHYIPVSLAVLLLYTFPAQVVAMTAILGMERLTRWRGLAFAIAFAGVALAVGDGAESLDWRGVGLGLAAGSGLALTTVLGSRMMSSGHDEMAILLPRAAVAAALPAAAVLAGPGFAWPTGAVPWAGYLFAGAAAGLGLLLYFLALPLIGPLRVSLLSNLEPVIAILAAIVILGERPAPGQFAGMAMVLGAIGLLYAADYRYRAD